MLLNVKALQGNVFWELFVYFHGTRQHPEDALAKILSLIKSAASALGAESIISSITLNMIKASGRKPPKLKLKAAEGRHMLPITTMILENFMPAPITDHDKNRLLCTQAINKVYNELEESRWDPETSPAIIREFTSKHLLLYAELSKEALETCVYGTFWRLYPKHHLFYHVIHDSEDNPRSDWCYTDEHEIGNAVSVAEKLHVSTLATEIIERYRF